MPFKTLKSFSEKDFEIAKAFEGVKIIAATQVDITEMMMYVYTVSGLISHPNDAQRLVLKDFILKEFKNVTTQEVRLAFQLAMAGKLDCETKHYENFSCQYFAQIVNAYKKNAIQVRSMMKEEVPELPPPKIEPEENYLYWENEIESGQATKFEFIPQSIYDYIVQKKGEFLNKEEKGRIVRLVENYTICAYPKESRDKIADNDYMKMMCKKLAAFEFIKNKK